MQLLRELAIRRADALPALVPPMSGRGTSFVVPLTGLGIHNFYLRVRVRVDKAVEPTSGSRTKALRA